MWTLIFDDNSQFNLTTHNVHTLIDSYRDRLVTFRFMQLTFSGMDGVIMAPNSAADILDMGRYVLAHNDRITTDMMASYV